MSYQDEMVSRLADLFGERESDMFLVCTAFDYDEEAIKEYGMTYSIYGLKEASRFFRFWLTGSSV